MATAYSAAVSPGGYNLIRLRVEYTGTSATCYIEFSRTSTWTDTWGDDAASITFNGQTVSAPYWYTGTVDGTWRTIDSASGFTVSTSGGTYSWSFNNPLTGSVLQCSGTIDIPAQQVAPNTPTVSVATNSDTSLNVTWGTSSFGVPNTGTAYIYSGTSASPTQMQYTKTTTGNSLWTNTGLTPNTKYYYRARAKNTADLWSAYSSDAAGVTKAKAADVSLDSYTTTNATIYYSVEADGGEYNRELRYSLDNGTTWNTAVTISDGSAHTGTYTITGLTPNTSYTIRTNTTTTVGSTTGNPVSVITQPIAKMYGSVNGQAKQIVKMYGSIKKPLIQYSVTSLQNNAGFNPSVFNSKWLLDFGVMDKEPAELVVSNGAVVVKFTDNTYRQIFGYTGTYTNQGREWGFVDNQTPANGAMTSTGNIYDYIDVAKKIVKIYGSVNGSAKLIYEDNS